MRTATAVIATAPSTHWRIDYGTPPIARYGQYDSTARPGYISSLYFHSLAAALHSCLTWTPGSWWEIITPDGRVAVSSRAGVNEEVIGTSPPLMIQQLLHSRYGMFPESVEEGPKDQVSRDDGETWEWVLLGEGTETRKSLTSSLLKPKPVSILSVSPVSGDPSRILISHAAGNIAISPSRLELKKGRTGYSLQVLNTPRGVYTQEIDEGTALLLQAHGVGIAGEKEKLPKGFVKAWKPSLFKIRKGEKGEGEEEVKGFSRGLLGMDKRKVEYSRTYGEGEHAHTYTYTEIRWHLTHLPTGYLIAAWKHKNVTEEFADYLRERMPELTDTGMEITPETGTLVREILDTFAAL